MFTEWDDLRRWAAALFPIKTSSLEEFIGQVRQKKSPYVKIGMWDREHHKDGMPCEHHMIVDFEVHEILTDCEAVTEDGRKIIFEIVEGDYPHSSGECPSLEMLEDMLKPALALGCSLQMNLILENLRENLSGVEIIVLGLAPGQKNA
jgi:hypothetical protein